MRSKRLAAKALAEMEGKAIANTCSLYLGIFAGLGDNANAHDAILVCRTAKHAHSAFTTVKISESNIRASHISSLYLQAGERSGSACSISDRETSRSGR